MSTAPRPTPAPPAARRNIVAVLFLGVLMAALDIAIVGPALPAIATHFGLSERSVAWVFNTFVLFNLMGVPLMAKLSDVFGRRTVYVVDIGLFAVGALVVALAPSFAVLLVGRGLQGLGASGIFPVASAVVGDAFAPARRGRVLGILGAVFGVAFIVGPILAGLLLILGWPWLFVMNLPLAVVVVVAGLRVLPATRQAETATFDWRGLLALGTMLVAFAYGLNQIDTAAVWASLTTPRTVAALGLAALLLPVFIALERRTPDPVVRLALFANRQVALVGLLAFGAGLTEAAFIFFPALAVAAYGVSGSAASFMLLPLMGAIAVGSPLVGRLLDYAGSRAVVMGSAALIACGMAVIGFYGASRVFFYAGSVPIGVGLAGLLGSSLNYILLRETRAAERTVGQGIITVSLSIGQLTGSAFIGAVAASGGGTAAGYQTALLVIAAIALVLTLLAFGLRGRTAEQAQLVVASE